ncbi:MAG: phospho-sugar mutase [Propionibacteriaceae bacterium]|nr:phospho-sugar mutase [Propionibacteriaceae bacterium]
MSPTEAARGWLAIDPDPDTRAELQQLLDDGAEAELADAFRGPLEFGTAGLRGRMGPGPNRMNRVVVAQAAAGIGDWLVQHGHAGQRVLIGFDARHKSADFAKESAELLAGAGFEVLLVSSPTPTPVVAFGIRHLGCAAAIVVTASHNPAADNGYKVYLGDGSQIIPPTDAEMAVCIAAHPVASLAGLPRSSGYQMVADELLEAYVSHTADLVAASAPQEVAWVHTAMHGVGARAMRLLAARAGFAAPNEVASQADPDPDFPTVAFPNPEEAGAIDLALELASTVGADVVIANDPDADRCAVAAVVDGAWRMLTGDELGLLLGDHMISRGTPGVLANSVVSSRGLAALARARGREQVTTLTGFKWIGRVPDLAFGYEEAIGYCCDSRQVPDKDGLSAALMVLELTAALKARGLTLADRLDELTAELGLFATAQLSLRFEDLSLISQAVDRLRATPPATLLGGEVAFTDLSAGSATLPPTNAVMLASNEVQVIVRPSGTEPKLKCYLEVVLPKEHGLNGQAARSEASTLLLALREEVRQLLGMA